MPFRCRVAFFLIVAWAAAGTWAWAGDRANVPLKNWGGFSVFRDSVYDDLERLVTAGLGGRVLLSTKPLTRIEAARIVARAIEQIRGDQAGVWSLRRDLEPVLDRLIEEFRTELASLGVKVPGNAAAAPDFFPFLPVDRAQVRGGYASRDLSWLNSQGLRFQGGVNSGATFESRAQIGDFLTFYVQPEFQGNEEFVSGRLATGYAKLTLYNVELLVGRDSLWWGPGLHGSLIFSNNAPPLDQLRIGAAEPFLLPWVGEWVGPTKLLFFVAQLEERREDPRARLAGMRATISPVRFLEVGISRAMMFGGRTRPRPDLHDFAELLVVPEAGDDPRDAHLRNNNLFAVDGDLRVANADRYFLPARDLRFYGELGWDDSASDQNFLTANVVPKREAVSWLLGVHLLGVFGQEGLEARLEYARSSGLSFTHGRFTNGYWTRGEVISHFMGTDGEDFYARVTNRLTPNLMLGLELNRAVIGSTVAGFQGPKERRIGGGIDLSWRFWDRYSLFGQYQIMDRENRNFRSGDDGIDHLLRVEVTRSFR